MAYFEGEVPVVSGGSNDGMFGGNGWWAIILFAMIFGWGRGNWGCNGSGGAADNYVLASDFATLQRQIDSGISSLERKGDTINSGICNGFYAMNTGMLNGFSGVNQAIMTNGYETRSAINGLSSQLAECCCTTQRAIDGVNYNLANQFAQTNYNMAKNTSDIIQSGRDNTQRIIDYLCNDKISTLQAENSALRGQISQGEQTATILRAVNRTPSPAYVVPNPYCCNNYTTNSCGTVI